MTAELTWDVVLIDLCDDCIRSDHEEVLILSWVILSEKISVCTEGCEGSQGG